MRILSRVVSVANVAWYLWRAEVIVTAFARSTFEVELEVSDVLLVAIIGKREDRRIFARYVHLVGSNLVVQKSWRYFISLKPLDVLRRCLIKKQFGENV